MIGMVAITAFGFIAGIFFGPPTLAEVASGLAPRFTDETSLLVAVGIFGATIMPHAIYAHSALARDRFGSDLTLERKSRLLSATKLDVALAMTIAGLANLAILLIGAVNLFGVADTDTIPGAHAAFEANLGPVAALIFAIGLLASGLASTSVGAYAGAVIMDGLLRWRIPVFYRRLISLIPALIILVSTADATWALVVSQVVLSFGIPFALFPLIRFTSDQSLMGQFANRKFVSLLGYAIAVFVTALNAVLLVLTFS
jgi:manganese transport protein